MKAVIMAGGKGTRLHPLTVKLPKPMVGFFNLPVIEYTIQQLKSKNITQIAITLQFMPEVIMDYLGNGSRFGVELTYFLEDKPMGTAGSVKNAKDFLDEDFIIVSGDAVCNFDFDQAKAFHEENHADVTLLLYQVPEPLEYGVVVCNEQQEIIRFIEKPPWSKAFSDTVNTGIYILKKEVLNLIPDNTFFDFSKDLFPDMLEKNKRLMGYLAQGYWCDIGDNSSYLQCQFDVLDNKQNIGDHILGNTFFDHNKHKKFKHYQEHVKVIQPSYIGENVQIGDNVTIGPYAIIEDGCIIGDDSKIKQSVIKNNSKIGEFCQIRGSIIADNCLIADNCICLEHSVVGNGAILEQGVVVMPDVGIWPDKVVPKNQRASKHIIHDFIESKPLFKDGTVEGHVDSQLTAESALKLGAAMGQVFCEKRIIISDDGSAPANLMKLSLLSGLCAMGAMAYNTSDMNEGALSYLIKQLGCDIGIYIKSKKGTVTVSLFNQIGVRISHTVERKLEKQFEKYNELTANYSAITQMAQFDGAKHIYIDWMAQQYPVTKGSKICVSGEGVNYNMACQVLQKIGFVVNEGTQGSDMFYINDDGMEVITAKNQVIREERLLLLIALIYFKENAQAQFCVPIYAPAEIERLAKQYDGSVLRLSSLMNDDTIQDQHLYSIGLLTDPVRALCHIACYTAVNQMSIETLLDEIPECYFIKREVPCGQTGRAALMHSLLSEAKKGKYELKEGIKIFKDNGFVLIIPKNEKDEYKIYAQGNSQEYANEICDFYQGEINRLSKK